MGRAVLVAIGPGPSGRPAMVADPVPVEGGAAANDVVAAPAIAGATHLVAIPGLGRDLDGPAIEARALDLMADVVDVVDEVGLACFGAADADGHGGTENGAVVVNVAALLAVGGFDPDQPGLGWLDLVDRLGRSAWRLQGVDVAALPFVPVLTAGLDVVERVASEGRWLVRHGDDRAGRRRLDRYHRLVLAAIADLRHLGTTAPEVLDRLEADAGRRWAGQRPDEAQRGVGRRADWRHLLPPRPTAGPRSLAVLIGLGPIEDWRWLVDDGWVDRIDDQLPAAATAEVIVIGPEPIDRLVDRIEPAVAALADGGALCLLASGGGRSLPVGRHRRLVRRLHRSGLGTVRRHLALPDAASAKRYVPLDHPGGLAWLAGPAPALPTAALPRRRRLVRDLAGRLGDRAPGLLGDLVVVATADRPADWADAVVITSGFDEGSRTVLLPFDDPAASRPSAVVKVTARPAYGDNGVREHELLTRLAPLVDPPGLVPEPRAPLERDGLPAVVESYAGRWTATDILNEQSSLAERAALLDDLLAAVTALNRTGAFVETWNDDGFEALIGRWFDELDDIQGPSPTGAALRAALDDRSRQLTGRALPFGLRHFDLGPWNLVLADADRDTATAGRPARSPVTVVDWELAPPRTEAVGPIGTDQLYLTKYWLHIAGDHRTVEEEQSAFAFLADDGEGDDGPRRLAKGALSATAAEVDLPLGFLPLLEASVWAEAACFTSRRRQQRGGDGGSPARYLATLARRRVELLQAWA